jgi:exosortase A
MNSTNTLNSNNSLKFHLLFLFLLAAAFAIGYHTTLSWMYGRYMSADSYYSHGFLIPFVTGFFIWQKREELKKANLEYSRWGLVLIVTAVLIHILGTLLYVFSISGFSILFLVFGVTLFLFGRQVTRIIVFPLLFLAFMLPVPEAFISTISFPLKMLVAKTGVDIVRFLGIPAFREGFNITIPAGSLLVGNPCSGLRSLIAFMALGSVFAYMIDFSLTKKIILFLVSIPIAILSNIVRVPILILISHGWGLEAAAPDTFWHTASGVLVFVIGLGALFLAGRLLQRE